MKELILAIIGIIGGIFIGQIVKRPKKTEQTLHNLSNNEEIMNEVYAKNPPIRTKADVLKELNRYRHDN